MTMHRELNPQLFGNQTQVEKIGQPVDPGRPAQGIMGGGSGLGSAHGSGHAGAGHQHAGSGGGMGAGAMAGHGRQIPYPPIDLKQIEHSIATMKLHLMQMDKKLESTSSRLEDLARNTHARLERFAQAFHRMEEINTHRDQDNQAKFANMSAKVNERKVTDSKVQELVDRHNTIIRNFENRLLSLQRVISEQEMALHNAQAALEESRIGRRN
jgi:hypothetical protein